MGTLHPSLSVQPILLLSLPRAGSTLVQRVLAAHPLVATASEPWLLLPLAYSLRHEGARAEYWHPLAAMAVSDLADGLPGGRDQYLLELGELATRVYGGHSGDARYFVDKTPRYHLIADELPRILPEARLIFLWRNPLAVVASLLRIFRARRWEPHLFRIDLYAGVANLAAAWERHREDAVSVRYEDLLEGDEEWRRLFGELGLEFDPELLTSFTQVELRGRYGDPTGIKDYHEISPEPQDKWVADLGGPVRKRWCRRYLEWIGDDRLRLMGYEREELLAAIDRAPSRPQAAPVDAMRSIGSRIVAARHARTPRRADSPQPVSG